MKAVSRENQKESGCFVELPRGITANGGSSGVDEGRQDKFGSEAMAFSRIRWKRFEGRPMVLTSVKRPYELKVVRSQSRTDPELDSGRYF
jgi:hypothetical protein